MYPDARPTIAEYSPILGDQSKFHRVILDEAHWIKNKLTKSAVAACYIQSEYRWCMTGKSRALCEIVSGLCIVCPNWSRSYNTVGLAVARSLSFRSNFQLYGANIP